MGQAIETTSDMLRALEDEIEAVKSGTISESQARVVFRGRALQIQMAALNLQYQRMLRSKKPEGEMKLINPPPKKEEKKD